MSRIRTAALSAVIITGFAVFAGAQAPAKADSAMRGMRDSRPMRGQMDGMRKGGMKRGGMRGERGGRGHFMKDLNLTDAQKAQVKTIHTKYQPQFKALRDQGATQMKALRDARQKGDTSSAARARVQQQREQFRTRATALRQQEQNEIRGILTAEQRAKWDAGVKERKDRFEQRQKSMTERRGARGARGAGPRKGKR